MSLGDINYERRGSGEPLVLIHGIGSRWEMWLPVIDRLATHHDVIAIDIPGFGRSPAPTAGTPPGVPSLCRLIEEFWTSLGLERPHVAGNSMGGQIVLDMAARDTVRSVTALSPGGFVPAAQMPLVRAQLIITREGTKRIRRWARPISRSVVGRILTLSGVIAHPARVNPEEAALAIEGGADATWFEPMRDWLFDNPIDGVTHTEMPVTVAWGQKDRLLSPRGAAKALTLFPYARFVPLPDCGHIPTYDDPDLVARTILQTTGATPR